MGVTRPIIPARPTVYKGVQMRSRLEADYAGYLDRQLPVWGGTWRYEPVCFGSEADQWLPDFSVDYHGSRSYTEVKPVGLLDEWVEENRSNEIDALLTRISVAWESEPEAQLELVFWEYKAKSAPLSIIATSNIAPWVVYEAGSRWPHGYLWPGMGQWVAVGEAAELKAVRA